jgi:hypothetical protein
LREAKRSNANMTNSLSNARAARDDGQALKSVPLGIRLIIAAIFVAGVLLVFLPSYADVSRSKQVNVKHLCYTDAAEPMNSCK